MNLTYVIVAGGQGKRLGGRHKGLISLGGRPIVQNLVEIAAGWPTWINTNVPEPYAFLKIPMVGDIVPNRGAPGGILTALWLAQTEWIAVVACDMPFVTRREFELLMEGASEDVDVVCFRRDNRYEPMVALYRRQLLQTWLPLVVANPSMQRLLQSARVRASEISDDRLLQSINTPDDLERCTLK